MLGCGVVFSLQAGAVAYSVLDYRLHHGTLPLGRLAIALQAAWAGGLVLTAGCLWLFPDGHLPRGRWRPVGGALFALGLLFGAVMFVPFAIAAAAPVVRVDASGTPFTIDHPTGSELPWVVVVNIGFFALLLSWVVWLAVQVPRYRRSSGELAYAIVTGLLVGVYAGLVRRATQVLRLHSTVAVAAATLAAAALFNPLRKRVQRAVDRRFNRARYDAEATVATFAGRLRESVDLASIQNELAAAVDQAFEPTHISVWLTDRPT